MESSGQPLPGLYGIRDIAARVDALCDELVAKLQNKGLKAEGDSAAAVRHEIEFQAITACFFAFARDLFNSVRRLEESGCLVPSRILARSLFEALVSLLYIETDPEKHTERFLSYAHAQSYKRLLTSRQLGYPDPLEAAQVLTDWESVKDKHGTKKNDSVPRLNWHGRNLAEILEELTKRNNAYLRLKKDYLIYYKGDSEFVHASVEAIGEYIKVPGQSKSWVLYPEPAPRDRIAILARCSQWMLWILAAVHGFLWLGPLKGALELQRGIEELAADP